MRARDTLTLRDRAKVAKAVGATIEMPGGDLETILAALDMAEAQQARAGEIVAKADQMAAAAQRLFDRARRMLGWSFVMFGIGIGCLIAGVIL